VLWYSIGRYPTPHIAYANSCLQDGTLWYPEMYMLNGAPFKKDSAGAVSDRFVSHTNGLVQGRIGLSVRQKISSYQGLVERQTHLYSLDQGRAGLIVRLVKTH